EPDVYVGPLEVLRYSPEGSIPMAPELSVTFSQPMVALTSQEEAAANVPVKLTPEPPGKWRWLGTRTLIFRPDGRFPMSTSYRVTVPAGTRAANGSTLATEKSWSFSTPPLTVKSSYPVNDTTQARDALMFMEFDQRIDPAALLPAIKVTGGDRVLKTRLATSDEVNAAIAQDKNGTARLREAPKDKWIAFRAIDPKTGASDLALPSNSQIKVSLTTGAPSAEGPNLTQKSHNFEFRTYGPFKVTSHGCIQDCGPYDAFEFDFSNALSGDVDESRIRVEPAIGDLETFVSDSNLMVDGLKRGDTTYRITLDKSIKDRFNQTLGRDVTFTFKVGPSPRRYTGPNNFVVTDPAAPTTCSVFSVNFTHLKVQINSVTPDDWPKWLAYQRDRNRTRSRPGRSVFSRVIPIRKAANDVVETAIDLRPALTNGHGQLILIVEPSGGKASDDDDEDTTESWIQVTDIGLDAFADRNDLVGWVTSLKDGTPMRDVDVTLRPSGLTARSGPDGLARLAFNSAVPTEPGLIVARRDGDVAILPESLSYWKGYTGSWFRKDQSDSLRWFVFDDRKMYRPGEEVHVKGWIRQLGAGKTGDIGPLPNTVTNVAYTVTDSRNNQLQTGSLPLNAFGGFDWSLKLPDKMNLGSATLRLQALSPLSGNIHQHMFQVQEFRRPEFEVKTQAES
ncbi:MAG TPA: Ig-like domain-containing protein, partial [Pyrinomonadaceae bacterium]|nr:Ig-like domain-containing protein [Pyrinomonadaceae bacterium]